jgi:hypothetical protein
MAEKNVKLDVIQPNKSLEIKFKATLTAYFLTLRRSVLFLFLLYLINCKCENDKQLQAQKAINKRKFRVKNITCSNSDSTEALDEQLKQYIFVIMMMIGMLGGKRETEELLAVFTRNIVTNLQTAVMNDLRPSIFSYMRSQAFYITRSMRDSCVAHGMNEQYVNRILFTNTPPVNPPDALGDVPVPPNQHSIVPPDNTAVDVVENIGENVQNGDTSGTVTEVVTGGGSGVPPQPPTGIPPEGLLRGRWLSANAERELRNICITATIHAARLTYRLIADIVPAVVNWIYTGQGKEDILRAILVNENIPAERAAGVVLQITLMTNQAIQRLNMIDLGFEQATWIHVPGEFTSRETHIKFNQEKFDLNVGLYDEDVHRNVFPGELWWCRCVMRGIIPSELTGGDNGQ